MNEQTYPFEVAIYKGEGRYAIEPLIQNYWGMRIFVDEYRIVDENADAITIASAVDEMKQYIQSSPRPEIPANDAVQPEHISKYHDKWIKFLHNNLCTMVRYTEDEIDVFSLERRSRRGGGSGYCGGIECFRLPVNASLQEIGDAILKAFDAAEKYYSVGKYKPKRQRKTTKTED